MTEIVCKTRALSTWTAKCKCADCRARYHRMRKLRDNGAYRRLPSAAGLEALDRMLVAGYNGLAVASATGVSGDTARTWVKRRKAGHDIRLGPVACLVLVNATEPRQGIVNATIARRKARALGRLGWGAPDLAKMMREQDLCTVAVSTLSNLRSGYLKRVSAEIAYAVNELYRQLHMTPAPVDHTHNWIRAQALKKGWAAPLAWGNIEDRDARPNGRRGMRKADGTKHKDSLDPIAVERACVGDCEGIVLTRAEKVEVVDRLRLDGKGDGEIERITGISQVKARYPRKGATGNGSQDDQLSGVR